MVVKQLGVRLDELKLVSNVVTDYLIQQAEVVSLSFEASFGVR
jgi:hypothetical protein